MTPIEILKAARDILKDPAKWYQGGCYPPPPDEAFNQNTYTPPCMCAWMAVGYVAKGGTVWSNLVPGSRDKEAWRGEHEASDLLNLAAPNGNIITYNDDPKTTHDDIMRVFSRAIDLGRGAPI